ncbi:MAG: UPF0182 family protein [Acidimicrobiales bacterium]
MRAPADVPRRGLTGRRVALVVIAAALFALLTSLRGIARFYTDYLWFDEVGFTEVWRGVLGAKIGLTAAFSLAFFVLMWTNLAVADQLAPRFRAFGPEDEIVQRYRDAVGRHTVKVRTGVALMFALIAGTGAAGQWNNWILFRNGVDFGLRDAQFDQDVGFFVFQLPFLSYVVDWAFVAIILVVVFSAIEHYLTGGIRVQSPLQRVTPQAKAHLSILLALLALVRAADYWLRRFELTTSSRGPVDGAGYTDVNAQLPALNLLLVISVVAAGLFLLGIRLKGWVLPAIAVGLWGLVAVAVGAVYPAVIQNWRVNPAEPRLERPFIDRNIRATRAAMGIEDVRVVDFEYAERLDSAALARNAPTVRNVRLWDPQFLRTTYQRLQEIRGYYQFPDVDIDRYTVNGEARQIVLSVRELNTDAIPGGSWVNRHLQYTHGFGAVLSPANAVDADGRPDFLVSNIPPQGELQITEPRIYYGESMDGYAFVNSRQDEIDYQEADGTNRTSRYDGEGGVRTDSFVRRLALALRFGDINPVISDLVTDQTKAIYLRDIPARVRTAAPFLRFDADPYPVLVDGRILWVQDAYTTSARYPYGQRADVSRVPGGGGLRSEFNYVRNSVKVVIDAYHGSMTFYMWDAGDPIVRAYARAFPGLFTPKEQIPEQLLAHLRYPEDLFRVQTSMFGRYHITDATEFYRAGDAWDVAQDPGSGAAGEALRSQVEIDAQGRPVSARLARMDPAYLLMRLPGEQKESFLILQPFVPTSTNDRQQNLTAFLVAKSDPADYGNLQAFVMPRGQQIDGPLIVEAAIAAEPDISREITQLNQQGSTVLLGTVQVIPIEQSLLYVRPLYVTSSRNEQPLFERAIVVFGGRAVMRPTLQEALTVHFGQAPDTLEAAPRPENGTPAPTTPGTGDPSVLAALAQADTAFAEADAALRRGDFATYAQKSTEGIAATRRAYDTLRRPPSTTTTQQTA